MLFLFFLVVTIVRTYNRKTSRAVVDWALIFTAVKSVLENGHSVCGTAKEFGLNYKSLGCYVEQVKSKNIREITVDVISSGYGIEHKLILSKEAENELPEYVRLAEIFYGMMPGSIWKLAFDYVKMNYPENLPEKWNKNDTVDEDWFSGYMKRHPNLSLRTPQLTSLAQARGFNKPAVEIFYDNYEAVLNEYNFTSNNIWNLDEFGITTVPDPPKVVAKKGQRQVGQMVSKERGELVTMAMAISADGNKIPPFFIFSRKKFKDLMVEGCVEGNTGDGTDSGWQTEVTFLN